MRSGEVIAGRYQLGDVVGAGGMGKVWQATDLELRRTVALKETSTGDDEEIRREAKIGAGLHHPNVISVFDVVEEGDQRWLVMEYLPARSLAEMIREDGPIPAIRAARVGAQIATALSAMHAKGMVHRDVTPSNILVADDGTAKLIDLGITTWDQVTRTGTQQNAGTPAYMAPELLDGHHVTPAADVYSLGATLRTAVRGHDEVNGRFANLLARLTDPSPSGRPTADEAAKLLTRSGARRPSRGVLVGAGVGMVAVLLAAVVVLVRDSDSPDAVANAPGSSPRAVPPGDDGKLLYGVGDQLNSVLASELVRETPVRMLTTNYHKPSDLSKLAPWGDTAVPEAYAEGYALHLIVSDWEVNDPEISVTTSYGVGCGRAYVLSSEFPRHMRTLARIFAGQPDDPPLYVTVFQDVNKMGCKDGYYADEASSTAYYEALKDRYLEVLRIFHEEAPNSRVALGWDAWQAGSDDPKTGYGRSMFGHFADVLAASDFQSVIAKQRLGNVDDVRQSVRILGEYGPVMVAAYGNERTDDIVDGEVRALLSDTSIAELIGHRLFAWNFNSEGVVSRAGKATLDFVKDVVRRTGRGPQ
ncbi:serine/threonine protein kinase [Saccharothrix coeruleofusca]|uniref:serine/threonine-protein kinase n=1 Tax=Saccharothrix coeruleofusca TaxID=33919 RepID=UPI001AE1388A|nr:serine/threonine-protein kinase [Saccharothrix coeruleofusca]MBP2337395.1 serine/threonine protein kinase [Saccharothrix coeruleofusca]